MKRHVVIVALKAEQSYLQIDRFLKIARSYVVKVCKDLEAITKRKTPAKGSNTIRSYKFVRKS